MGRSIYSSTTHRQSGVLSRQTRRTQRLRAATAIYLLLIGAIGVPSIRFLSGHMVVGGVPSTIILRFLRDPIARRAYFNSDTSLLHDRLSEMGVEEQLKMYHRSRFLDEDELDRHIHQIMFNHTGYIGEAYRVAANGMLVPKEEPGGR